MNISTNTILLTAGQKKEDIIGVLKDFRQAGFKTMDISYCASTNKEHNSHLCVDNWKQNTYDIKNEAEKLGINFTQSHPPFIYQTVDELDEEYKDHFFKMLKRSIMASSILGVKWAILHPIDPRSEVEINTDYSIKYNREVFEEVIELAMKQNVGIAYENMVERPFLKRRFASLAEELAALIDSYKDERIGACWDTGHGNMLYRDQSQPLRALGKRIKALHINDNSVVDDHHVFPFNGTTNWNSLLPVLREIEYSGDFTFETHTPFLNVPYKLRLELLKYHYKLGEYCLSLI